MVQAIFFHLYCCSRLLQVYLLLHLPSPQLFSTQNPEWSFQDPSKTMSFPCLRSSNGWSSQSKSQSFYIDLQGFTSWPSLLLWLHLLLFPTFTLLLPQDFCTSAQKAFSIPSHKCPLLWRPDFPVLNFKCFPPGVFSILPFLLNFSSQH